MVLPKVRDIYMRIGFTRYKRIQMFLSNFEKKIKVTNEEDKNVLSDINILINERLKAVQTLYVVSTIAYFGLYFSFISIFLSELIILGEFTEFVSNIVGFLGTTLFVVILFFASRLSDLYYQDLSLLAAHAINIYGKYKHKFEDPIYEDINNYISFINFFKHRYK